MKKLMIIALLAIMLIGMLTFAACKPKEDAEATADTLATDTETPAPVVADTTVKAPETMPETKPAETK